MIELQNCIHGKNVNDCCLECDKTSNTPALKQAIKTIDVNALEWFDKVNGNSYFAGTVIINYGLPDQKGFKMPFQYGYEDFYVDVAGDLLQKNGFINLKTDSKYNIRLWQYCRDNNIILRTTKHKDCKKRELMYI